MTDEPTPTAPAVYDADPDAERLAAFYGESERADAQRLKELVEAGPEQMGDDGWREFREIAGRSPERGAYESRLQLGDTLYIKAWLDESEWYRTYYEERGLGAGVAAVVCLSAVYPIAWLLMAGSLVNAGALDEARKYAEASLALEEHPSTLAELATIVGRLGQTETALGLFVRAYEVRDDTPLWHLARAARGIGVSLVDLGRLDDAEEVLRQSLELDPDSPIARDELRYIAMLRTGTVDEQSVVLRTVEGLDAEPPDVISKGDARPN